MKTSITAIIAVTITGRRALTSLRTHTAVLGRMVEMKDGSHSTTSATPPSVKEATTAAVASATELRQRGNHAFSTGRLDVAVALYSEALERCFSALSEMGAEDSDSLSRSDSDSDATVKGIQEEMIVNLCNRAASLSQQNEWQSSLQDAARAWELSDFKSIKAAYRLCKISLHLKDYNMAKKTIQAALRLLDDQALEEIGNGRAAKPEMIDSGKLADCENNAITSDDLDQVQQKQLQQQRNSFQALWKQVLSGALMHQGSSNSSVCTTETSIKYAKRPVSIKEFNLSKVLGHGNFSEIIAVTHKVTGERFALKKIEKKQAADLYKRQHPNVYNEIQMERRVLLERLSSPGHPFIIRMYHAFQDYSSLYYLMDLHVERGDMWSQLRYKNLPGYGSTDADPAESLVMMGCHRSTARLWLYELVSALEYVHARGIVHRDLKAENVLLSATGHVVLIDFGTAKDLLVTDLNGPEFVGTPDFMSPEAVTGTDLPGTSSLGRPDSQGDRTTNAATQGKAGPEADLWALGALAFIMQTGHTPYWSPSPYLAFLKIKRALEYPNLTRPSGIVDDDCWDFVSSLMAGDPMKRLGAGVFASRQPLAGASNRSVSVSYDVLRDHPYFDSVHNELRTQAAIVKSKALPIPSLVDVCIRAVAEMAYRESLDINLCDRHPPGDGSKHDLLRLGPRERAAVLHCLDRRRLLNDPQLYARFFLDSALSKLDKIRRSTRDFVGLTQMNDDQGKPPKAQMHDPYAKAVEMDPIKIIYIVNPLFSTKSMIDLDDATRKHWIKLLRKCVAFINRSRPNLVIITGQIDCELPVRHIIARISDTIPTVVHDGSGFFSIWKLGVQCLALQASTIRSIAQMAWLKEQLEQVRMSKHPLFVFVDADPRKLPPFVLKKLARGRALCIFGLLPKPTAIDSMEKVSFLDSKISYKANERVDDISVRSTDSDDDENDSFTMKLKATGENGLYLITVEEEPDLWTVEFEPIGLPER